MASEISLFSGYDQKENRTTNYCLLILKLLYEEHPPYLGEFLSGLLGEDISDHVGVRFTQQSRRENAVPDGLILQQPLFIFFETKLSDWFHDDQLKRHLGQLDQLPPGMRILFALSNFEATEASRFERIREICRKDYDDRIRFAAVSFEDFVAAIRRNRISPSLVATVADFEQYLDSEGLLGTWKTRLDAVNCAGTMERVLDLQAYACPTSGGAYSHARSRFFGAYKNKAVSHVAEIEAVVDVASDTETILWNNGAGDERELKERARNALRLWGDGLMPGRVFLLGGLLETDFRKTTKGGMFGSKRYFDVASLKVADAGTLAASLRGRPWSDLDDRYPSDETSAPAGRSGD